MYYAGIDLGGTNIVAGVLDENYNIIAKDRIKTALPRSAESIIDDMAKAMRGAIKNAGITLADIDCVGVGCPGSMDMKTGVITYSNNLDWWNVPLVQMLSDRLDGKKVVIDNDANAAALGELKAGCGVGKDSIVAITLGTGVGGGVIFDGKILSGFNGAGGELGHTVTVMDGEPCTCGRKGCFEAYASATALIRQTKAAMEKDPSSKMWEIAGSIERVNGLTAFEAMRAGDAAGKAVVDRYIYNVACGITNFINIFQPEVLCLGGGVCNEGDNLLRPLISIVEKERYSKVSEKQTEIKIAKLGNDAGIIGAALLSTMA